MQASLQQAQALLPHLTRSEKAQLLQWIVQDLGDAFPGIESTTGVNGGEPTIVRTRIPVWILVHARNMGMKDGALLQAYPGLRAEDLANAWGYYRVHQQEIEQQIKEHESA